MTDDDDDAVHKMCSESSPSADCQTNTIQVQTDLRVSFFGATDLTWTKTDLKLTFC